MEYFGTMLVFGLLLSGGTVSAQVAGAHSIAEQYLMQAANAERAQRGLPALRWDDALYRAAVNHAIEMARRESISHQYPGEAELSARGKQAGAHFSVIAENVAEASTAVRIHDAWMKSEGHRENILDPRVDAVGISVILRNGQLYAVQDFDRSVEQLSYSDQESAVAGLLSSTGQLQIDPEATGDARRTCEMDTGFAGSNRPWFVMRYTTSDIRNLPDQLRTKLGSGEFHRAAVGACAVHDQQAFTAFNIAVLLYPR